MINKDNIEALIEFGGLVAHKVSWFDAVRWKTNIEVNTFNEEYAIARLEALLKEGFPAKMETYMIHFNYN